MAKPEGTWLRIDDEKYLYPDDLIFPLKESNPKLYAILLEENNRPPTQHLACSLCGGLGDDYLIETPFCPWCGAEMHLTSDMQIIHGG